MAPSDLERAKEGESRRVKMVRAQSDLNQRPIDLQSIALPLSYAPRRILPHI